MTHFLLAAALMLSIDATTKPTTVIEQLQQQAEVQNPEKLKAIREELADRFSAIRIDAAIKLDDPAQRQSALLAIADDMAFVPTQEAPEPEGWPAFTPILEIELKQYPAYRMAIAERSDNLPDATLFWKLFGHIQKNDIPMTAPVEMTLDDVDTQRTTMMGFLYQSGNVGMIGQYGMVKVIDVPAQHAISIGERGETNPKQIADAAARIEAWLEANKDQYVAAGPLRILGYNSPSLDDRKKYYEVQRVVNRK